MPLALPVVALSLVALLTGCSSDGFAGSPTASGAPYGTATGSSTGTDTGPTQGTNQAEYFALIGSIALTGQLLDPTMSTLEVDYRNLEADPICSGIRPILDAAPVTDPAPADPLFGSWILTLDVSPCGDLGPDTLQLGIGGWDEELTPAAAAENLTGDQLYGLYLGEDVVFGATGTSEQFSGPAETGGVYQLRTLLLLPLAP